MSLLNSYYSPCIPRPLMHLHYMERVADCSIKKLVNHLHDRVSEGVGHPDGDLVEAVHPHRRQSAMTRRHTLALITVNRRHQHLIEALEMTMTSIEWMGIYCSIIHIIRMIPPHRSKRSMRLLVVVSHRYMSVVVGKETEFHKKIMCYMDDVYHYGMSQIHLRLSHIADYLEEMQGDLHVGRDYQ